MHVVGRRDYLSPTNRRAATVYISQRARTLLRTYCAWDEVEMHHVVTHGQREKQTCSAAARLSLDIYFRLFINAFAIAAPIHISCVCYAGDVGLLWCALDTNVQQTSNDSKRAQLIH
jgi:hypothetical protein